MGFDYRKFLAENQLTTTSRLKEQFYQEDAEFSTTPDQGTNAANKASDKAVKLKHLTKQKDEILAKYKNGQISLDQYKTQIGNIPQQIKQLRADIDAELNPDMGDDMEGEDDFAPAPEGEEGEVQGWDQPENDTEEEF